MDENNSDIKLDSISEISPMGKIETYTERGKLPDKVISTDETAVKIKKHKKVWIPDQDKQFKRKNDTCVLLGTAATLKITPWDNPNYDYIACAPVITYKYAEGHRIDLIFEMHYMEYWVQIIERLNEFIGKNQDSYIYMQNSVPQVKNSLRFPIGEIQDWVEHDKLKQYFTSTIAFMIAFAIYSGYKKILLFGIHMAADEEEYSLQRSCCEAWLNYGLGKGIDYYLPDESEVMRTSYIYGYEQEKGIVLDLIHHKEGLVNGREELKKKLESIKEEYDMQRGGVLAIDQIIKKYRK